MFMVVGLTETGSRNGRVRARSRRVFWRRLINVLHWSLASNSETNSTTMIMSFTVRCRNSKSSFSSERQVRPCAELLEVLQS